jgi:hypothetical protein
MPGAWAVVAAVAAAAVAVVVAVVVDVAAAAVLWLAEAATLWLKVSNRLANGSVDVVGVDDRNVGLVAAAVDEEEPACGVVIRLGLTGWRAKAVCAVILIRPTHWHFARQWQSPAKRLKTEGMACRSAAN